MRRLTPLLAVLAIVAVGAVLGADRRAPSSEIAAYVQQHHLDTALALALAFADEDGAKGAEGRVVHLGSFPDTSFDPGDGGNPEVTDGFIANDTSNVPCFNCISPVPDRNALGVPFPRRSLTAGQVVEAPVIFRTQSFAGSLGVAVVVLRSSDSTPVLVASTTATVSAGTVNFLSFTGGTIPNVPGQALAIFLVFNPATGQLFSFDLAFPNVS